MCSSRPHHNHLFSQPSTKEGMDGLVGLLAFLHQDLLGDIHDEGTRERWDGLQKSTKTKKGESSQWTRLTNTRLPSGTGSRPRTFGYTAGFHPRLTSIYRIPEGILWSFLLTYRYLFLEATWLEETGTMSPCRPSSSTCTHTRTHTVRWLSCMYLCCTGGGALTMLRTLRPTAPAGRIPLGPCSNTAPSDLLVELSQPPTRLLDSNKITCR